MPGTAPCRRHSHLPSHPSAVDRQQWDITREADRGQATAELAVGLPSVFVVFFLAAWMLSAVSAQARCADAARVGARLAARGETTAAVFTAVTRAAPSGATMQLHRQTGLLDVEVSAPTAGLGHLVPTLVVTAHAVAPVETAACPTPGCSPPEPP